MRVPSLQRENRRIDFDRRAARRRKGLRTARAAVVLALLGVAGYHGFRLADARGWLDLFQIREVRVVGNDIAHPAVLVAEAGLMGEPVHYWSPLGPYVERVLRDPMVAEARFRRRFPNRLVLEVVERTPVALLALDRLAPVDASGRVLPVSAFQPGWNVPVIETEWPPAAVAAQGRIRQPEVRRLVEWLVAVTRQYPALAHEISALELDRRGTVTLRLVHAEGVIVLDQRTPIEKLALVDDVLRDLREKGLQTMQLDLRFEDQIVARPD